MKELEQAKEVFLTDVDEETYKENIAKITEWERNLMRNRAYLSWRSQDITQEINKMARNAYREHALALASNRSLTDDQRTSLYAKQDACLFLLSLTDQDAKSALDSVLREIRHALNVTT